MEKNSSYGQFCPVAMAAELVCTRWTPLVLRELLAGSTRFNDLRKGVPRMSPALLSTRLKELEDAGIMERRRDHDSSGHDYHLTQAGRDLWPVVEALGGSALAGDAGELAQSRPVSADVGHAAQP